MTPSEFNAWRIFPRILIFCYCGFFGYAWFYVTDWFMQFDWKSVDNQAVALALAAFPAAILTVISVVLSKLIDTYMKAGGPGIK